MSSTTPPPIALDIRAHDAKSMKALLSHVVSLDVEDNINILKIGGTTEKVKISQKCLDQIRLVVHQFQLYQRIATELRNLPKSVEVDGSLNFYMSLVAYFKDIISAFHGEAKADASSSTSKWRSAYLDYHMALSLHGSSFTTEKQITALKEIKRTWTQFREKKGLKEVQQLTGRRMHAAFCSDGENMCGGPFEHTYSEDDVVSTAMKRFTTKTVAQPISNTHDAVEDSMDTDSTSNFTAQNSGISTKSSDVISIDVEAGVRTVNKKTAGMSTSSKVKQGGHHKKSAIAQGSSKKKIEIIDVDSESPTDEIASRFESNIKSKRNSKERRQSRRPRVSKVYGKKKAPASPAVESGDDDADSSQAYHSVPPTAEEWPKIDQDEEGYDDVLLPSVMDDFDQWTKTAFEEGNSHVFLKLAAWMLMRFRQLTTVPFDAPIDGVVIPSNPRVMEGIDDDHFFEALGMERLYTAIVHMETSPRYMCHLFHALGKAMANSDVSASNPRLLPCNSPPAVEAYMISDMEIPLIALNHDEGDIPTWKGFTDVTDDADGSHGDDADGPPDNDADGSPETDADGSPDEDADGSPDEDADGLPDDDADGSPDDDADGSPNDDHVTVTEALDSMIIEDSSTSVSAGTGAGDSKLPKRKRTSSQVSPPKKDGGRGPAKRRKDGAQNAIQSTSPIQSLADIDESGFVTSPPHPHSFSISNASSPRDDASIFIEPWDADMGSQERSAFSQDDQLESSYSTARSWRRDSNTSIANHIRPVVLVPNSESSQHQRSRNTTPALPPIASLPGPRTPHGRVPPGTFIVVSQSPRLDGAATHTNSDVPAQDKSEIEMVPHDDSGVSMK
ncbi:hypothetical protein F4604DRAFT_1675381 [Suillus subluteus]|nr:hypothetical protein F4604DRAFT_1675381 [Suillus subluteus]